MGVEHPFPGSGVFHSTLAGSNFTGYAPVSTLPLSCGPRQRGQSRSGSDDSAMVVTMHKTAAEKYRATSIVIHDPTNLRRIICHAIVDAAASPIVHECLSLSSRDGLPMDRTMRKLKQIESQPHPFQPRSIVCMVLPQCRPCQPTIFHVNEFSTQTISGQHR